MTDRVCSKCGSKSVEIIVMNFDYQRGMARCKLCLHKMRLKDYYYWEEHNEAARGGGI